MKTNSKTDKAFKFDWFEITADDVSVYRLKKVFSDCEIIKKAKGVYGYPDAFEIRKAGLHIGEIWTGKKTETASVETHVQIKSEHCLTYVQPLKEIVPEARLTRADVAIDFVADFDVIACRLIELAKQKNVKWEKVTNSGGGETLYLGSRKSEHLIRLYKKTEQLQLVHKVEIPPRVVRLELQKRPAKRSAKEMAYQLSEVELIASHALSRAVAKLVLNQELEEILMPRVEKKSDFQTAVRWMVQQYSKTVLQEIEYREGDLDSVFDEIRDFFVESFF